MLTIEKRPTLPKFYDLPTLFAPEWASKALRGRLQEVNNASAAATRSRQEYIAAFEAFACSWDNLATADPGNFSNLDSLRSRQLQDELLCREAADRFVETCGEEGKAEDARLYKVLNDSKRAAGEILVKAGFQKYADPKWIELDQIYGEHDTVKAAFAKIAAFQDDLRRLSSACNTNTFWTSDVREALLKHRQKQFAAVAAG